MRYFNNILNLLSPDYLMHADFQSADRRQRQHILGIFFVALCTLVGYTNMGQAGIGAVNQAQVSNYCPVPQNTVIAQPKMLFLFLDHHLDSPTFQITADNLFHRQTSIISNQSDNSTIYLAFGKYDFDLSEFFHSSDTLSKLVTGRFSQTFNAVPSACSVQNVPAVVPDFVFGRFYCKPSIRPADADKRPFPLFTSIDNSRAKIECIEQNSNVKFFVNICIEDNLTGQFSQFFKRNLKTFRMLFFDIKPRAERDCYTSVEQAGFNNGVAVGVFTGGMVIYLADSIHLFSFLDRLGVIDNQQAVFDAFFVKFFEQPLSLAGDDTALVKVASPEKFTVVGSVCAVSEKVDKPLYSTAMTDTDGQNHGCVILVDVSRKIVFDRVEKRFDFLRNFTDSKHAAPLLISIC